jgi:Recombination endonuclease VII
MDRRIKQFCPKGHDTFVAGRTKQRKCKICIAIYWDSYRKSHKEKIRFISRKYEAAHKDQIADQKLRSKYGFSLAEKQILYGRQNGICATCPFVFESVNAAHLDHSHETGKIRGLLCGSCNHVIGKVKDSPARLRSIADYLEQTA